ncbi:two-component sensor histidine kinase [Nocardiopsis sp. TSRI0078]|uniref:sensor histidine kinase n=1 Tax=unclassified Nocardiopsis TaxID=2649073 RepID=UPI0009397B1D|nr:HAMP domain-containing sensor histidine kinase [Nocardiopsis sp. TSRI0078]OKI20396.1 two-component sensor histidine kinase [Nocardiopsis sp. TSRI0078]
MSGRRPRLWPRSLGGRLTLVVLCLTTVCLVAFGTAGTLLLQRSLTEEADHRLRALPVPGQAGGGSPPLDEAQPPPLPTELRTLVVGADGGVLESVGQTDSDEGLPDVSAVPVGELRERAGEPLTLPGTSGEDSWRVLTTAREDGTVLVAAQSLAGIEDTLDRLVLIEAVAGLVVLSAVGFGAAAIVRFQLRPLREIESTAQAIAAGDLDRRIPCQDPATETGRLGRSLNTMLGELSRALRERDRAVETTRRFVADASHELRTPLSSIRGFAELYRQGRGRGLVAEDTRTDRWMSRIEDEAERMGSMVDDLLVLSRFDEAPPLERSDMELASIAERVVAAARARAPHTPVALEADGPVRAVGDADRIRQVLENLVDNALTHTPEGTPVHVSVTRTQDPPAPGPAHVGALPPGVSEVAVITVRDEGQGLSREELPHVFDRFYRADGPRKQAGAGLGLAISAAFVAAHDGYVTVESPPGGGSVFTVVLPLG